MNSKQQNPLKKLLAIRGMGAALTAFVGLVIIYIAFGLINPAVFSGQNILNLLRSMSKYLLIGIAQSYVLITGNIDLAIGSMVGMSAMITATLMTGGMNPVLAILIALVSCLLIGVVNGYLVGKFKLPPFIATLGTMFVARGIAYMVNGNRNTDAIATGVGKETADKFQNLLKPINKAELAETLEKLKSKIGQKRESERDKEVLIQRAQKNENHMRSEFVLALFDGNLQKIRIHLQRKFWKIPTISI